jgi:ABC-type transport system involved in multi-copper enzyme maturation permease subunit
MIWKIAKKDCLLNLMTFKFAVGTVLCVVLMAVFMPVLVNDYEQRLKDYNTDVAANEAELRKVRVYKNITPTVYHPPTVLSVFSIGLEKQLGKSAEIKLAGVSEISAVSDEGNPFLSIFPTLDVALIFKIVMSVMALLVAYDTISGEREQGTLKLILSSTIGRYQVLIGKLLAGLITLVIPTTLAFIVGLLILLFFPMVELTGLNWTRVGLMYVTSLFFISTMYNLGLLSSSLMRRSSISLVVGLFVWVIFVVVIPNGSVYLANYLRPTETKEKMNIAVKALAEKRDGEINELTNTLKTGGNQSMAFGAFGQSYILMCEKPLMDDFQKRYTLSEPINIKYADKIFEAQQEYLDKLISQKYLASTISRISPVILYENIMSTLSGTDLANFKHFTNEVKSYTDSIADYIKYHTEDFFLLSYFTPGNEEDYLEMENEVKRIQEAYSDNFMAEFKKWYDRKIKQTPSLDLQDLPRFTCRPENLIKTLCRALPNMVLLIVINALFFVLSFVGFVRYDIR